MCIEDSVTKVFNPDTLTELRKALNQSDHSIEAMLIKYDTIWVLSTRLDKHALADLATQIHQIIQPYDCEEEIVIMPTSQRFIMKGTNGILIHKGEIINEH